MRRIAIVTCLAGTLLVASTGSAGAATLTPTSANFGSLAVGTVSPPKVFTLTPELTDVTLAITTTGDYKQTNNCPGTLGILSGPCTINVTFNPTAGGTRTGVLSTTSLALGGPTAALAGIGDQSGGAGAGAGNGNKCSKKKGKGKKGKKRAAAAKKKGKKGKGCGKKKKKGKKKH